MSAVTDYESGALDDLEEAIRRAGVERAAARRENGVVYTPSDIAEAMVRMAGLTREDTVWEPSCGHGAFVFPVLRAAREFCGDWAAAFGWFRESVIATDLDPGTASDLRRLLAAFLRRQGVEVGDPDTAFPKVFAADALSADVPPHSVTLGNPPYVRTREMDPAYLKTLRTRFPSMAKGNVDLYYAFIERAAAVSGRVVFIVPNACLTATGARTLREACFPRLREVCDFGATLPFADARTYVAILRFGPETGDTLRVRDGLTDAVRTATWRDLSGEALAGAPKRAMSGIATLADACFLLMERDGVIVSPITGEAMEPDVVRRLVKATKPGDRKHILFPYAGRRPLPEAVLAEAYPAAFRHLCAVRERLEARDKGKTDGYPAWFAYGRSQGLHDLTGETDLIIVPAMVGGNALPFRYRGAAPLFVSGFAVRAADDPTGSLLTPAFRDFVMTHGKEKPGVNDRYHGISVGLVNAWLHRQEA